MKNGLVSIVLTTYNRRKVLERAIDSLLRQKYENWQCIIEDDGSTDGTGSFLKNYLLTEPRLQYHSHPNVGPSQSRNRAYRHCVGEFITFLDSDDEYLPDHLQCRVEYMNHNPNIDFVQGGIVLVGSEEDQYVPDARYPLKQIHVNECVVGGTFFMRRHVLDKSGQWPEGFAEDFHLLKHVEQFYQTEKVLFPTYIYHRDTADSRCSEILSVRKEHQG
jgi:glycosyltransferase involved in cell wall biosynthesis